MPHFVYLTGSWQPEVGSWHKSCETFGKLRFNAWLRGSRVECRIPRPILNEMSDLNIPPAANVDTICVIENYFIANS